jgi:Na+-translocating ferredoxin:NAD+ oxidoreductase RnfE subunit
LSEEERRAKRITTAIGYAVSLGIGIGLVLLVANNYGYSEAQTKAERVRILCDAFTIPGVCLMLCAALVAVYNQGVFTGVTYGLRRMKDIFLPFLKTEYIKYPEYKKKKEAKKIKNYSFLFFSGLLLTIPAVVLMIYFYQIR